MRLIINSQYMKFLKSALILMAIYGTFSLPGTAWAQSAAEAFRYSSDFLTGTARNVGVGGTMGSLGADFSVLSSNPAGIARYKSTEFTIAPAIPFGKTEGNYLGNTLEDDNLRFNLSGAGIVFARRRATAGGWNVISGGVGINRLNNYNDNVYLTGTNTASSLLDMHANLADGYAPDDLPSAFPFDVGLTYLGELILPDSNLNYTPVYGGVAPKQSVTLMREGGKYEMTGGIGASYNDVIYVGGSIGIPIVRFNETFTLSESDEGNAVPGYNFFDYTTELRTLGYGFNFKAGVLGIPHKLVRVGMAFHTPTIMRLEDAYLTYLESDFETVAYEVESPSGEFDYTLVTPWKFLANAAVLLDEYGFVAVEYAVSDPGKAKYRFKADIPGIQEEENTRNDDIAGTYTWQHQLKTGIEIKLSPVRLRAGFQYVSSGLIGDGDGRFIYSGGLGYRGKHFFVDGAYSYATESSVYYPYEGGGISSGPANLDRKQSQITLTVGAKL